MSPADAQSPEDGIMLRARELFVGHQYSHDSWDEYWEGPLKRDNGNIGTLTTQTNTWFVNYAVTDRLNVITTIPYVWTQASQGVLHEMRGFQDLTIVAKFMALETPFTSVGNLRAIGVLSGGLPLTDYTPDFMPLSIGTASRRIAGRFTTQFQSHAGWFGHGSLAHTWRSHVTLDRPFYFTEDRLTFSSEVPMPAVVDYTVSGGYHNHEVMIVASYSGQRTQGGGDIRRQDMPFVSNRMNFSKVGAMVMAPVPRLRAFRWQVAYAHTLDGRNVGQASTITAFDLFNSQGRPE